MSTTKTNTVRWLLLAGVLAGLMGLGLVTAFTTATVTSNSINVANAPTLTLTASGTAITLGQTVTFTANVPSGGFGPFTVNLMYDGSTVDTNSITSPGGSASLKFTPSAAGTFSLNAVATDTGTTNTGAFTFNSDSIDVVVSSTGTITTSSGTGSTGGIPIGGGPGGPTGPTVTSFSNLTGQGYVISNLSDYNSKTVVITNKSVAITIDFITQTTVGVTINSRNYNLTLGVPVEIDPQGLVYYALLTNITYVTTVSALHSAKIMLYSAPTNATTTISPATVNSTTTTAATTTVSTEVTTANATAQPLVTTPAPKPGNNYPLEVAILAVVIVVAAVLVYYYNTRKTRTGARI